MKSTTYYFKLSTLLLLLSFIPIWAIAQSNTVKGTVKDTFGEAVIGANVTEWAPAMVPLRTLMVTSH